AGADDPVLLALEGGHDVGHAAGAAGREGGQQGGLAAEVVALGVAERVQVEHVVLDPEDLPAPGPQVPAADHPVPVGPGGPIERLGRGSSPVDQQRFAVVVEHPQTADVQVAAVGPVEPPEAQAVLGRGQLGQAPAVAGPETLPVHPGPELAAAGPPLWRATNASRSPRAWTLPPPSAPRARSSSAWVRSRRVSRRRYSMST